MSDQPNELDLFVGSMILVRPDEDRAAYEEEVENVSAVQDALREQNIEVDLLSQPGTEVWEGGIETIGALYQLARLVSRLERGGDIAEVIADGPVLSEDLDPLVTDVWDELFVTAYPHLLNLQGINSYFMPAEFDAPTWLPFEDENGEDDQVYVGSSIHLQRELAEIGPRLIAAGVKPQSVAYKCLETLAEAAAASVKCGMPLAVW
jgi:hypothetical protein